MAILEPVIVEGKTMVSMENGKGVVMKFFLSNVYRYNVGKEGGGNALKTKESFMLVLQVMTVL